MTGRDTTARIRFAVIGDVEPKHDTSFANFRKTVELINELAADGSVAFTACIGDIAHRGSEEQYEKATDILAALPVPFYSIMGNEELMAPDAQERFLRYAALWNHEPGVIPGTCYVKVHGGIAFIFATAHTDGTTFSDAEIAWIEEQVRAHRPRPVMIFTHAPMPNVFPDAGKRTMKSDAFRRILAYEHVQAVFSGHTHFDLATVQSAAIDSFGVHHIHIPGIERTKVGPAHTPRFRMVTVDDEGRVLIETYNVLTGVTEKENEISFSLRMPCSTPCGGNHDAS